jgi:hypothetical protein
MTGGKVAGEQAVNQNVSFYPTDLAILEEVQKRNGQTLSGAVRFILREWARTSGLQAAPAPQSNKSSPRKRVNARKNVTHPDEIQGVKHGMKAA